MAQTLHDAGHIPDPDRDPRRPPQADRGARPTTWPRPCPRLIDGLARTRPLHARGRAPPGRRALRLAAARPRHAGSTAAPRAEAAFRAADNMTEEVGALACLLDIGAGQAELAAFEARWSQDRLVMDKWFALQIGLAAPGSGRRHWPTR